MAKSINQIVNQLTTQGYDIKVYKRKNGGYLITKINGRKFTGATGNQFARQLVGETLSVARKTQLSSITAKRYQYGKDIYKEYKRITTLWRKTKLPKSAGKITFKKFQSLIKNEGMKEALKFLGEKERYASGIAYSKNVSLIVQEIRDFANKLTDFKNTSQLYELANDIEANSEQIRESDIIPLREELYRFNSESLTEELISDIISNIRSILNI